MHTRTCPCSTKFGREEQRQSPSCPTRSCPYGIGGRVVEALVVTRGDDVDIRLHKLQIVYREIGRAMVTRLGDRYPEWILASVRSY